MAVGDPAPNAGFWRENGRSFGRLAQANDRRTRNWISDRVCEER